MSQSRCHAAVLKFAALALLGNMSHSVYASPGADVPWTTYEGENMSFVGAVLGPAYGPNTVESESSGRKCLKLSSTGQYGEFTAQAVANAMVVRYSVPDAVGGGGVDSTLSLYTNGVFAQKIVVTSKYSWLYYNYPFSNNPTLGSPRNFYDEIRVKGLTINADDVIRLQKNADDTAAHYVIDLVDLENIAARH